MNPKSLEAAEDIINSNSADSGKYPNYMQIYTEKRNKKKKKDRIIWY